MMPWELKPAPTNSPATSGVSPRQKFTSGVNDSGAHRKRSYVLVREYRDRPLCGLADRREVLPVGLELAEGEAVTDGRHGAGLALRLEGTDQSVPPGCVGRRETRRGHAVGAGRGGDLRCGAVVTWTCSAA